MPNTSKIVAFHQQFYLQFPVQTPKLDNFTGILVYLSDRSRYFVFNGLVFEHSTTYTEKDLQV